MLAAAHQASFTSPAQSTWRSEQDELTTHSLLGCVAPSLHWLPDEQAVRVRSHCGRQPVRSRYRSPAPAAQSMMDAAERRTVETLKSSFKHIATTLDAACITTRIPHCANPTASSSASHSDSSAVNTSLARILADHHRIRGSALRCLMTALDIDRLAIDKAYRHIALLHESGQHREAGQAERAVRGYPPLLEVLHVVMEKNGVEEWDRWTRREENAERDSALGKYVPFPFTAAANSHTAQQLPTPMAHLLPTLAERQVYDDPPVSSPPRSPPRSLPPPLFSQPGSRPSPNRVAVSGARQAAGDGSQSLDENFEALRRRIQLGHDRTPAVLARRAAAEREKERQQRLAAKKLRAIRQAEEEEVEMEQEEDNRGNQGKEEASEVEQELQNTDKQHPITVDDEMDAEVHQLASVHDDDGAADVAQQHGGSPSDAALPMRPQLLAGISHSPTAADVSPIDGVEQRSNGFLSPYTTASPINGDSHNSYAEADGDSAAFPLSLSASTSSSPSASSRTNSFNTADSPLPASSQPTTRPVRNRKKAPRYGEDDLYTPSSPHPKPHRSSPRKPDHHHHHTKHPPASPTPHDHSHDERLWEIDNILCFRFRAYPPFHQLAGSAYRSFLIAWNGYEGGATWVMEDDLVSVDKRRLERLPEWDEWRVRPENAEVEVEEEEPWVGGGEEALNERENKKRRRGMLRTGSSKKKKAR